MSFIDTEFDEDEGGLRVEDTLDWPVWIAIDPYEKLLILKTCRVADIFANWREAASWVNAANARMGLSSFISLMPGFGDTTGSATLMA